MKVITQLIRHFWERGALSADEVEYLLRHGFARKQDVPGFQFSKSQTVAPPPPEEYEPPEPPTELEIVEESLVRRHTVRRTTNEPHPRELKVEELQERVRDEFARRMTDLQSILALGSRIQSVKTWQESVAVLRSIPPERFHTEMCAGLQQGRVLLGDLWQATDAEAFHRLISEDEAHGQAARAFLALLITAQPPQLGKYVWILRLDEAQAVMNLRVVHGRVLASLCRLYRENRLLLTRALSANRDVVQIWSLILLYNAHRDPLLGDAPDYGVEYGPLALPSEQVWRAAWTNALGMDRSLISKFLMACYDESERTEMERDDSCRRALMCPVGWHIPDEVPSPLEN